MLDHHEIVLDLQKDLHLYDRSRPVHSEPVWVRGNIAGQGALIRLVRSEPLERQLLPVVGPDFNSVLGQDFIGLVNPLPIRRS